MSKLLKFKRLLTIDESIQLLQDLIGEHITLDDIKELTKNGFLVSYHYKNLLLAEVKHEKKQFYKIVNNKTGMYINYVPNVDFTYFHFEHGKICLLESKKDNKQYALIDEQDNFIEDCREKNPNNWLYLSADIFKLAELANKNELISRIYGKQEIPIEVIDSNNKRYIDHIYLQYFFRYEKDDFISYPQGHSKKKVSESTQLLTISLLLELLKDGKKLLTQDAIKLEILQRYPKTHKVSNTVLSNLFAEANKELDRTKKEI